MTRNAPSSAPITPLPVMQMGAGEVVQMLDQIGDATASYTANLESVLRDYGIKHALFNALMPLRDRIALLPRQATVLLSADWERVTEGPPASEETTTQVRERLDQLLASTTKVRTLVDIPSMRLPRSSPAHRRSPRSGMETMESASDRTPPPTEKKAPPTKPQEVISETVLLTAAILGIEVYGMTREEAAELLRVDTEAVREQQRQLRGNPLHNENAGLATQLLLRVSVGDIPGYIEHFRALRKSPHRRFIPSAVTRRGKAAENIHPAVFSVRGLLQKLVRTREENCILFSGMHHLSEKYDLNDRQAAEIMGLPVTTPSNWKGKFMPLMNGAQERANGVECIRQLLGENAAQKIQEFLDGTWKPEAAAPSGRAHGKRAQKSGNRQSHVELSEEQKIIVVRAVLRLQKRFGLSTVATTQAFGVNEATYGGYYKKYGATLTRYVDTPGDEVDAYISAAFGGGEVTRETVERKIADARATIKRQRAS